MARLGARGPSNHPRARRRSPPPLAGLGIPLATLDTQPALDVAIDGADEVDPQLDVVKGRGGALLREKMVEMASKKFVCIVDETKLVEGLGGSKGEAHHAGRRARLAGLVRVAAPISGHSTCGSASSALAGWGQVLGTQRLLPLLTRPPPDPSPPLLQTRCPLRLCSSVTCTRSAGWPASPRLPAARPSSAWTVRFAHACCACCACCAAAACLAARPAGGRACLAAPAQPTSRSPTPLPHAPICPSTPTPAYPLAGDKPYVTDNSNFIVDLYFQTPIVDSAAASAAILALEGVVDHGLFLGMVDVCIIAGSTGVEVRERK